MAIFVSWIGDSGGAKQVLEENGFIVLMPAQKGNRKQLTANEANVSRRVTKICWVVEAIDGIIGQKFRWLQNQVDNKLLPRSIDPVKDSYMDTE